MTLLYIQEFNPIDTNSLLAPFLQFGIVGSLCVIFGIVIWKQYTSNKKEIATLNLAHKNEIKLLNEDRKKEQEYLFNKLDEARKDTIAQAEKGQQELLNVSNKFIEVANDLKQFYANKIHTNG